MNIRLNSRSLICIFIIFLVSAVLAFSDEQESDNEKQKTVRIGFFPFGTFQYYNEDNKPDGYNVSYLNKISEYTGWQYEYVSCESWADAQKKLDEKKVDLIAPATYTPERAQKYAFSTNQIGIEYDSILVPKTETITAYEDFDSFSNLKFGMVSNFVGKKAFYDYAKLHNFKTDVKFFKDNILLLNALDEGEIDAAVTSFLAQKKTTRAVARFFSSGIYYMMDKNNYDLIEELNDAIQTINTDIPLFTSDLTNEFLWQYKIQPLTKREIDFIKTAPIFNVGCVSNTDPVSYEDKKTEQISGITYSILNIISKKSGLKFNYIPLPEKKIDYKFLQDNKINIAADVETNTINTRITTLHLTKPYFYSKKVFVGKKGSIFDKTEESTIALSTGSGTLPSVVKLCYPNFKIKTYTSMDDALEAIKNNQADFLLQNQFIVERLLSKPKYESLIIIPNEGMDDNLALSLLTAFAPLNNSESSKLLISILNKTISQLDDNEISRIVINYTTARPYVFTFSDFLYKYKKTLILMSVILLFIIALVVTSARIKIKATEEVKAEERKLRNITNNINGGVVVLVPNSGLKIIYANSGFLQLLGMKETEIKTLCNTDYITYVHPDDIITLNTVLNNVKNLKQQISIKLRLKRNDGTFISTLFNGTLTETPHGHIELYCVIMDITDQINMLEEISQQQARYKMFLKFSNEIFLDINLQNKSIFSTSVFKTRFNWEIPSNFIFNDFINSFLVHADDKTKLEETLDEIINNKTQSKKIKIRILKSDYTSVWCTMFFYAFILHEKPVRIIIKIDDIDAEIKEKEEIIKKSKIDPLSGLLRKDGFMEQAQEFLNKPHKNKSALVFIDIDNFKTINDKLGHLVGDKAIKEAAEKLQIIFSNYDIISRFGGDEFCVLIKEIPIETLKEKIKWAGEKLRAVYSENSEKVSITASMGIALSPDYGTNITTLMECADKALYKAKENGKDTFVFYSNALIFNGYKGEQR